MGAVNPKVSKRLHEDGDKEIKQLFHKLDKNNNGYLDKHEFQQFTKYFIKNKNEFHVEHMLEHTENESDEIYLDRLSDILFENCHSSVNANPEGINFEEFKNFILNNINLQAKKKYLMSALPAEIPRNCCFFIFILKRATFQMFNFEFPLDIIHYIASINALMGEFAGLCAKCSKWHHSDKPNRYHSGTWHGMTYEEFLNKKFTLDLLAYRLGDVGHFAKKTAIHATSRGAKDFKKIISFSSHWTHKIFFTTWVDDLHLGANVSLALYLLIVLSLTPAIIGPAVMVGGIGVACLVGVGHTLATPFIDGAQVLASNINPHYHPTLGCLEEWTCCDSEGSWASPCLKCNNYVLTTIKVVQNNALDLTI